MNMHVKPKRATSDLGGVTATRHTNHSLPWRFDSIRKFRKLCRRKTSKFQAKIQQPLADPLITFLNCRIFWTCLHCTCIYMYTESHYWGRSEEWGWYKHCIRLYCKAIIKLWKKPIKNDENAKVEMEILRKTTNWRFFLKQDNHFILKINR